MRFADQFRDEPSNQASLDLVYRCLAADQIGRASTRVLRTVSSIPLRQACETRGSQPCCGGPRHHRTPHGRNQNGPDSEHDVSGAQQGRAGARRFCGVLNNLAGVCEVVGTRLCRRMRPRSVVQMVAPGADSVDRATCQIPTQSLHSLSASACWPARARRRNHTGLGMQPYARGAIKGLVVSRPPPVAHRDTI